MHASPELGRDREDDSEGNKTMEGESEGETTNEGTRICRNRKRARRTSAEDRETHWINGEGSEINPKEGMIEGEKGRKVEQGKEREIKREKNQKGRERERGQRLWVESNNWLGMLRAAPQGSPADA